MASANRWRVRAAVPADHPHYVRLFAELGVDDPVAPFDRWCAELLPRSLFVCDASDRVVGYGHYNLYGALGHAVHVVSDPVERRRGVGRAVLEALAERLRAAGCTEWMLGVKSDNRAAIALYEKFGFVAKFSSEILRVPWSSVARLPFSSRHLDAALIAIADDAAIEHQFALPRGMLVDVRARADQVLLALRDRNANNRVVAMARFAPQFPGAYPFRVEDPSLVRPLLEALQVYARPEQPHLQVAAEDSPSVASLLRDAGATLRFEIVRMFAPL